MRKNLIFEPNSKPTNMKRFKQLSDLVMSVEQDFEKFYDKGNNAAGTRIRKAMQDIKKMAQTIRLEVQSTKNKEA